MKNKIIDTHFHVWDLEKQDLPWLEGVDEVIKRTFTFEELLNNYNEIDGIDFIGGIYVEVDGKDPIQEDEIIYDLCKQNEKVLATMMKSKVSPTMRVPAFATGIREPLHTDDAPKGRCLEESFIEGLKNLAKKNMPFESCNRVDELEDFYKTAKSLPEETFILNHLGNVAELSEEYKSVMKKFAKLDNVYVKVSGYSTKDKEFVRDLLKFVKETFRSDRLMYASNWPVVELYSNFNENLLILLEEFKDDEDFFYNNAIRCYNLDI
ncbi:amidohydrolase family protein [Peptoniphilus sp.]|uniref:amidohydrolase family protein n=1 Tax=Peptoniphilus sp. TaxID=1971214 RepID=UPI003992AFD1